MIVAARRPITATALAAALVALAAGCVILPPAPPAPPAAPTQTAPAPDGPPPSETAAAAATEGPYEITAEGQDGSVWSFEVTDSRVVEGDSDGTPAEPGHQLVEVLVDAQLLEGEPDFYHAFHVYIVDDESGLEYGLSTGSSFYAEDDLYSTGTEESFTDGVGIFHVPATIGIDHVRVTTDQGGAWDFTR